MSTLPLGLLPALLRNHAAGARAAEAAVALLVEHGYWLGRSDFRAECVHVDREARTAWVDWPAAAGFAEHADCAAAQDRVLRFAAALAGQPVPHTMPELLSGLDDRSSRLVVDAVRHALGAVEGAMVACDCGHTIPAVVYSTHRRSARHAGPGGACACGQATPHEVSADCLDTDTETDPVGVDR